ncbi:MAG TPA: LPXTG cell wall anchor domain-containing protein [Trebonia sp.]|nr:LPXTG cell wall anchor domain-containing protein [Trebonia sp.]
MPAMAAKSALRLIGSSAPQLPGSDREQGGASTGRPAAARGGTLPTTGVDLEGLAAAGIGFMLAGGGGLLAAGRQRRRQRDG